MRDSPILSSSPALQDACSRTSNGTYSFVKVQTFAAKNCSRQTGQMNMMTSRKVLEYLSAEPFRQFRIKMASGQAFEIRHPEMILVGRSSVRVHTVTSGEQHENWHDVSLMLMETLEPTDATTDVAR